MGKEHKYMTHFRTVCNLLWLEIEGLAGNGEWEKYVMSKRWRHYDASQYKLGWTREY